jgi:predicted HTH domain antitoxin
MGVTLTIPEKIFEKSGGEIARELLERAVLEAFRAGTISSGRLAEILDLSTDEANRLLKVRNAQSEINSTDIEEGRATVESLLGR